jgi:hypothetical protein
MPGQSFALAQDCTGCCSRHGRDEDGLDEFQQGFALDFVPALPFAAEFGKQLLRWAIAEFMACALWGSSGRA